MRRLPTARSRTLQLPLPQATASSEIHSLLTPPVERDLVRAGVWAVRGEAARGARERRIFQFRIGPGLLGRDGNQVAQGAEPGERLALELTDALPRQVELVPDRLERPRLALEAEPQLQDAPLTLGERIECTPHALAAERLLGLLERIGGLAVGEQVAELALLVRADRLGPP